MNLVIALYPVTIAGKTADVRVYVGANPFMFIYISPAQIHQLDFGPYDVVATVDGGLAQLFDGKYTYPLAREEYVDGAKVRLYPVIGTWKILRWS